MRGQAVFGLGFNSRRLFTLLSGREAPKPARRSSALPVLRKSLRTGRVIHFPLTLCFSGEGVPKTSASLICHSCTAQKPPYRKGQFPTPPPLFLAKPKNQRVAHLPFLYCAKPPYRKGQFPTPPPLLMAKRQKPLRRSHLADSCNWRKSLRTGRVSSRPRRLHLFRARSVCNWCVARCVAGAARAARRGRAMEIPAGGSSATVRIRDSRSEHPSGVLGYENAPMAAPRRADLGRRRAASWHHRQDDELDLVCPTAKGERRTGPDLGEVVIRGKYCW